MRSVNRVQIFLKQLQNSPQIIVVGAFIVIGIATLFITKAAVPSGFFEAEGGTRSGAAGSFLSSAASGGGYIKFGGGSANCGKQVQNYTYDVPFGNAVWNQPICNLARHPQSADFAARFFEWGHVNDGSPSANSGNGRISTDPGFPKTPTLTDPTGLGTLYTSEVYYASAATIEKSVLTTEAPSNLDGERYNPDQNIPGPGLLSNRPLAKIPWNPAWKSAGGTDAHIIVIDDRPGKNNAIYTVWGYETGVICAADQTNVCAFSVRIGRGFDGSIINYMTHEGYTKDRGVGLNPYATLVTADEVAAGEIRHALGVSIPNPSFGPNCTNSQLQEPINWSTVTRQCGTAVAPGSTFEWFDRTATPFLPEPFRSIYTRERSIPEGMRFGLDITYDQIEAWIDSRPDFANNPRRAETARIFARGLKDYGMMVVDTNKSRFSVQTEGGVNPLTAAKWKNLALGPEYDDNLLDGLVTANNVYVVIPPLLTCRDGSKSRFYCEWSNAVYTN